MIAARGMLEIAGCPDVRSHALPFKIYFYGACRDPGPELLLQQCVGHLVIVTTDIDVIIQTRAALFPFGVNIRFNGQGFEGGLVQAVRQVPATGTQMAGDFAVQLIEQGTDRSIQFIEAKEALIAKARHDPTLSQQHRALHLGLIFRLVGLL